MGAHVGAHVAVDLCAQRQQRAVLARRDLQLTGHLARVVGRQQVLAPVFDPFHGKPEPHRGEGDQEVLGIELAANAEAPAHVVLLEVALVLGHLQEGGDGLAVQVRQLGGAVDPELAPAAVEVGHGAAGLHGVAGEAVHPELLAAGIFGFREGLVGVADGDVVDAGQVGAGVLVDQHLVLERFAHVHHFGKHLVVDVDDVQRVLGEVAAVGHSHGHGLAHVAHHVPRQRRLKVLVQPRDLVHADGDGGVQLADVLQGEDQNHPRQGLGAFRVDVHDAGVGVGAAEDGGMHHVGQLDVVHVGARAGDEPDVLAPPDGSADVWLRHFREPLVQGDAPSLSCRSPSLVDPRNSLRQPTNRSFPRKRESRGGGGVLQRRFPAPPRLDSRFRGNDGLAFRTSKLAF